MKKKTLLILAISMNLIIWINSLMPSNISSEQSGFIVNIIYPIFKNIIDIDLFTTIIRKAAHFGQFMLLAIVYSNYYLLTVKRPFIITTIHTLLVAIIDEVIQLFVPGRAGLFTDVLIDFSGALFGMFIVLFYLKFIKYKKYGKISINNNNKDK